MSGSPRILSLDLGSQSLGLAEFRALPNGGLVLTGYRRRDILADPAAETDRNRQISETLSAMMRELGIKNGPIDYAVPGQSIFARFVKLPLVDHDKIERVRHDFSPCLLSRRRLEQAEVTSAPDPDAAASLANAGLLWSSWQDRLE